MREIAAIEPCGLTHASTFSGAGGTCLGFKMAGYRTLWANDCNPHARECYRANFDSPIDGRDIRTVAAGDVLDAIGLQAGELDVFEGSPPCTAFSTAGKREKGWGKTKDHAGIVQAGVEDLFFEWLRILDGLRPRAFVAENVAGLVRGTARGYYNEIMRRMKQAGYVAEARLLDAQWLGVPQTRLRTIFVGFREDVGLTPTFPKPLPYRYSMRDALPWLLHARYDTSGKWAVKPECIDDPYPAIISGRTTGEVVEAYEVQSGAFPKHYSSVDGPSPAIMAGRTTEVRPVAPSRNRPGSYAYADVDAPAPCVTIGSPGNDIPIPAGTVRRKLTIDEVRRLCSFPDDFALTGTYSQQWARLGNSVPPLMARAIAEAVRDVLCQ